jgi:hypothetical protein
MAYSSPFTVYQAEQRGKGVLFVQAEHDASMFQYTGKVDAQGVRLNRILMFHFVTEAELEAEVLPNVPTLEKYKGAWRKHLKNYKPKSQIVVLVKMGCGLSYCEVVPLEPSYQMCLGAIQDNMEMYKSMDQLEINLDSEDKS